MKSLMKNKKNKKKQGEKRVHLLEAKKDMKEW